MATSPKYVQMKVMLLLLFTIPVWAQSLDNGIKSNYSELPKELRLLAMLPLYKGSTILSRTQKEGRLCNIAIQKALEDINAFPDLLVGYNLTYDIVDMQLSRCDQDESINMMIKGKYEFPHSFIGRLCVTTRDEGSPWSTQIAYLATPSTKVNRWTTSLIRLTAPERLGSALVELLATYNWSRIAIICDYGEYLSEITSDIMWELKGTKVDVITSSCIRIGFAPVLQQVEELKNLDARVIVVNADYRTAIEIMCNAYKLDLYGKHFVWIFTNYENDYLWEMKQYRFGDCTDEELQKAMEGNFLIQFVNYIPFGEMSIANITYSDLIADIIYRAKLPDSDVYVNEFEPFDYTVEKCYDTVWVAALVLNCSLNSPDDPRYEGTSGRIRFEEGLSIQRGSHSKCHITTHPRCK